MTPYWRATSCYIVRIQGLIEVKSKPGEVADDEDNHNEDSDDKITDVSGVVACGEDLEEDPPI